MIGWVCVTLDRAEIAVAPKLKPFNIPNLTTRRPRLETDGRWLLRLSPGGVLPLCCCRFALTIPPTRLSPQAMHRAYYCKIMLSHESGCWQYEKQTRNCCYSVCE